MQINYNFECPKCKGTVLTVPSSKAEDPTAKCKSCGFVLGDWWKIRDTLQSDAKKRLTDAVVSKLSPRKRR